MDLRKIFSDNIFEFRSHIIDDMIKCGIPFETIDRIAIDCSDIEDILFVLKDVKIKRILEVGAYAGFSTLVFRIAFPEASIISIDPNFVIDADVPGNNRNKLHVRSIFDTIVSKYDLKLIFRYNAYFSCLPQEESLRFHRDYNDNIMDIPIIDDDTISQNGKYDFIFIDADHYAKSVYSDLMKSKDYLADEGLILLHDMEGKWGQEVKNGIHQFLFDNTEYSFREVNNIGVINRRNLL